MIPQGTSAAYRATDVWKDFFIYSYDFNGTLTVSGIRDVIPNYTASSVRPWHWLSDEITHVIIDNDVTSIGTSAFAGYKDFASVTIPSSVATIGASAFQGCTGLQSVMSLRLAPPVVSANTFGGVNMETCRLYVVEEGLLRYQTTAVWKEFFYIQTVGTTCELASLSVSSGTLTPAFSAGATSYSCSVPNNVNTLTITATAAGNDTVTGAGVKELAIGVNTFNLVVTAQDGITTKTYSLAVTRQEAEMTYFTVTFNSQGGSEVTPRTVKDGDKVLQPANPVKEGYSFGGWYREPNCVTAWNFAVDVIMTDITLFAKWAETSVTGTEDVFGVDLKIYPNPFMGEVRIVGADVVETLRATSLQMRVINAAGVIVHTQIIINPDETLRLEHLPAGVYFFVIENGKQAKTIKIIKIQCSASI